VQFVLLPKVLKQEGDQFYYIDRTWQPKGLIPDPYRRNLLKDVQGRYNTVAAAEDEFQALDRSYLYIKILRRMRLTIKVAQFAWRSDDLRFLEAVSSFFTDYGTMLRILKEDEARGLFSRKQQGN
jgi:hypothetical protein